MLSDYDEKNAFDIEKYVKNLNRAKIRNNDTLKANTYYCGDNGIKIVSENNERYVL